MKSDIISILNALRINKLTSQLEEVAKATEMLVKSTASCDRSAEADSEGWVSLHDDEVQALIDYYSMSICIKQQLNALGGLKAIEFAKNKMPSWYRQVKSGNVDDVKS